jgi:hypothetical protein
MVLSYGFLSIGSWPHRTNPPHGHHPPRPTGLTHPRSQASPNPNIDAIHRQQQSPPLITIPTLIMSWELAALGIGCIGNWLHWELAALGIGFNSPLSNYFFDISPVISVP